MSYCSVLRPDLFEGQVAIVTGGGSGIGRCTAHELASLGATVVITGRKQEKLDRTAAELREDGGKVDTRSFDIRDEPAVVDNVKSILAAHGRIDLLVNNAGGQYAAPAQLLQAKGFMAVVQSNLLGGFLLARECLNQYWVKHPGGAVVNMLASMRNGMPGMAHSGAARAGMLNLTHTLSVEWAPFGVRVNSVEPGWIASSGMDTYPPEVQALIPHLKDKLPAKRLGTEAEVSAAICFLLSPGAAYITGTNVRIDGGKPLAPHHYPMPDHHNSEPFEGFHRAVVPKALREDP